MIKLLTVIGARPQFIKAAIVSRAIRATCGVNEFVVHTGQHFDRNMSHIFFEELGVPQPNINLGIGGGTHGQNTGRMLEALEKVIKQEAPTAVLVYGDTDSTLAGALSAAKLCVPVVHIEAGLRSYNQKMPEEINRRLTDHLSDLLLVPTQQAIINLRAEGVMSDKVVFTGDVMYDAAKHFGQLSDSRSRILSQLDLHEREFILVTIHRKENTNSRARLCRIADCLSESRLPIVFPIHPRTRLRLCELGIKLSPNVRAIDPVGYLDMISLEKHSKLIVTDSGGIQKEAYFFGVPCVTLRDETEWVELIEMGWNRLISPDSDLLHDALRSEYANGDMNEQPYGDGNASLLTVRFIKKKFG